MQRDPVDHVFDFLSRRHIRAALTFRHYDITLSEHSATNVPFPFRRIVIICIPKTKGIAHILLRRGTHMANGNLDPMMKPTEEVSVRELFGIDTDMKVKAFSKGTSARVPVVDPTYKFNPDTTLAILAGYR